MLTTPEECEIIGALMGDGFIHRSKKYYIGFTGNPKTDVEYYDYILELVKKVWNKETKAKVRARGLRVAIYSKYIVTRLICDFGLDYNAGKTERVYMPKIIFEDWNLARATIRGLVDTDGTVFTANKPRSPNYPSIEWATSSKKLFEQVKYLLIKQGFRISSWSYTPKDGRLTSYRIGLNGRKNLKKWLDDIGFSNTYKLKRAQNIIGTLAQPGRAH